MSDQSDRAPDFESSGLQEMSDFPSELGIPEDEPGGAAEWPDQRAGERGKGVMIAPLRALHE